ncbi:hypothetical protein VNI00_011651 [Paramarasmius palmivorus]|uniref:F-box domain-containing protein n=1 Tax=Paramarasmius palmivorus TaxID=297713 RepID=A0AAW0CC08_9AGAR
MSLADPVELCLQCHRAFPGQAHHFSAIEKYLKENPGNPAPSYAEITYLDGIMKEAGEEIAEYETEMRELTKRYEEKREALKSAIRRIRVLVKPSIHHLPPEILSHIFLICGVESKGWWQSSPIVLKHRGNTSIALTLSQVCSKWRSLAFSLPELWTRLEFKFEHDMLEKTARNFHSFATFCLEKSADRALTISLSTPLNSAFTFHHPVLQDVLRHSHRWQSIHFDMGADTFHLPQSMPMLESLYVYIYSPTNDYGDHIISSPRLHNLQVERLEGGGLETRLDLSSLTSLILLNSHCSISTLLSVLAKCLTLSSLHFREWLEDFTGASPDTLVHATSPLRFMSLEEMWSSNELLTNITLPDIAALCIQCDYGDPILFPTSAFTTFMARSRCTLTSLQIEGFILALDSLLEILLMIPSLEKFGFQDLLLHSEPQHCSLNLQNFFQQMTFPTRGQDADIPRPKDQILLPNLIHLDIAIVGLKFSNAWLRTMVLSRCKKDEWAAPEGVRLKQLQSFHLSCSADHCDASTLHSLECLEHDGIDVNIDVEYD